MNDTSRAWESLQVLLDHLSAALPHFALALGILIAGWTAAHVLRALLVRLLRAVGLERIAERARVSDILRRGDIRQSFVELLGSLAYWLLLIATVIVALQYIGISAAAEWLTQLGAFVPRIIVSIVIFLFGTLLASFLGTTVRVASLNAGMPQGHLAGQAVHTIALIVTIIIALEQLQVVTRTIEVALYILMGTFGLAFALALGLGAQGFVKRFLEDLVWNRWKGGPGP